MERLIFKLLKKMAINIRKENFIIKLTQKFYCLEMFPTLQENTYGTCKELHNW